MPKNKELPREDTEDSVAAPLSYKYYKGMNDTAPTGSDGLKFALSEQLQVVNDLLAGDTPTLYAIKTKKRLDDIGMEITKFELVEDPEAREEIYREIAGLLASTGRDLELITRISTNDVRKATMNVKPLADPKRATLITPSGWDNPSKPLN